MNHAVSLVLSLSVQILIPAAGQSKNWYNWFEDNKGRRQIVNGVLPTLSCPYGYYRQFRIAPHEAGGVNLDGCQKCPVGVFGNSTDLTSPNCTAPCPIGTYNDEEGVASIHGCKPCPAGTYGEEEGLKTSSCSADCEGLNKMSREKQYFSMSTGLTSPDREYVLLANGSNTLLFILNNLIKTTPFSSIAKNVQCVLLITITTVVIGTYPSRRRLRVLDITETSIIC